MTTHEQKANAFRNGAAVRFNNPTCVQIENGLAILDLAAAARGETDPWWRMEEVCDLTIFSHNALFGVSLDTEMAITDLHRVITALDAGALAQAEEHRHSASGETLRREAGRLAMMITNSHTRASILTAVDGWAAIGGHPIDVDPQHGTLFPPPLVDHKLGADSGIEANILVVTCPSTGRQYAHPVPLACRTARDARRWVMGLEEGQPDPEIET